MSKWLITGGTGFIGQGIAKTLLDKKDRNIDKVISFSRRWDASERMARELGSEKFRAINGDITDEFTLRRAMDGVEFVIHAAAYKSVPSAEYNGLEAYRTNVVGTVNVIKAAIESGVKKVLFISSDKACDAVNLYGKTKAMGESLAISANNYGKTRFSVARYGNVLGSTGSVLPYFISLLHGDQIELPVTNPRMTRYWFMKQDAINFVLGCLDMMQGGEIFIPKLMSSTMEQFVVSFGHAVGVKATLKEVGERPGEKVHELMISKSEAPRAIKHNGHFIITPPVTHWQNDLRYGGEGVNFEYYSSRTANRLSVIELAEMISETIVQSGYGPTT